MANFKSFFPYGLASYLLISMQAEGLCHRLENRNLHPCYLLSQGRQVREEERASRRKRNIVQKDSGKLRT